MIVRANTGVSVLVEFLSGPPDGNIAWNLRGPDGLIITSGTIPAAANAVSANIRIPASFNALLPGLMTGYRDLEWTYDTAGSIVNGEHRYVIEARVPFGASTSGVRTKLGIDDIVDLPDTEISMVSAYTSFVSNLDEDLVAGIDPSNSTVRDAIEATAALAILPSLTVRLAKKEDSGTSSFQRQDIDWDALAGSLGSLVIAGYTAVDPLYDETEGFGVLFMLASPATDAITGA